MFEERLNKKMKYWNSAHALINHICRKNADMYNHNKLPVFRNTDTVTHSHTWKLLPNNLSCLATEHLVGWKCFFAQGHFSGSGSVCSMCVCVYVCVLVGAWSVSAVVQDVDPLGVGVDVQSLSVRPQHHHVLPPQPPHLSLSICYKHRLDSVQQWLWGLNL